MTRPDILIREVAATDEDSWLPLWGGYLAFYETSLPKEVTSATWRRILDPASPIFCRVAELDGRVSGMAVYVLHEGTWVTTPLCYLEDLFVDPEERGKGIGRSLLADLVALARHRGWSRLYWHTRRDNPARRLYDAFGQADDFVRYRLPLDLSGRPGR